MLRRNGLKEEGIYPKPQYNLKDLSDVLNKFLKRT